MCPTNFGSKSLLHNQSRESLLFSLLILILHEHLAYCGIFDGFLVHSLVLYARPCSRCDCQTDKIPIYWKKKTVFAKFVHALCVYGRVHMWITHEQQEWEEKKPAENQIKWRVLNRFQRLFDLTRLPLCHICSILPTLLLLLLTKKAWRERTSKRKSAAYKGRPTTPTKWNEPNENNIFFSLPWSRLDQVIVECMWLYKRSNA